MINTMLGSWMGRLHHSPTFKVGYKAPHMTPGSHTSHLGPQQSTSTFYNEMGNPDQSEIDHSSSTSQHNHLPYILHNVPSTLYVGEYRLLPSQVFTIEADESPIHLHPKQLSAITRCRYLTQKARETVPVTIGTILQLHITI